MSPTVLTTLATGRKPQQGQTPGTSSAVMAGREALGEPGPQHLQRGADVGQQGGIVAVEFGVQHALGQRLDPARRGRVAMRPRSARAASGAAGERRRRCCAATSCQAGRAARTARAARHAVFAGAGEGRGIGQRQRRQRAQRIVLGAGARRGSAASRRACGRRPVGRSARRGGRRWLALRPAMTKDAASSARRGRESIGAWVVALWRSV